MRPECPSTIPDDLSTVCVCVCVWDQQTYLFDHLGYCSRHVGSVHALDQRKHLQMFPHRQQVEQDVVLRAYACDEGRTATREQHVPF